MTPYSAAAGAAAARAASLPQPPRDVLGEVLLLDLLDQLVDLGLVLVRLPSSSWIAFSCWRRKNSRWPFSISLATCDWIFEPSSTSPPRVRELRDPVQALLDVRRLEQLLPLLGLEPERRGDQERQRGRVATLAAASPSLGQVRRHPDDLGELLLHRPRECLDPRCLADDLRHVLDLGGQVGIVRDRLDQADAPVPGPGSAASRRAP